ncbi:MAG: M17 family peptidase N-terminal domain-containing protein [Deltaproteobacteria bacterium]|nr:M17 family peptidase N-terminal domain-containing protein [Deltaproteobacteria bacterium]
MVRHTKADDAEVKRLATREGRLTEPTLANVDGLVCDSIVVGVFSDVRPLAGLLGMIDWRLCGRLSRLFEQGMVTGEDGERVLIPTLGRVPAPRLFLYGWGPSTSANQKAAERVSAMINIVEKASASTVAFGFPEPGRGLLHVAGAQVEQALGSKLVALFDADPVSPT